MRTFSNLVGVVEVVTAHDSGEAVFEGKGERNSHLVIRCLANIHFISQ